MPVGTEVGLVPGPGLHFVVASTRCLGSIKILADLKLSSLLGWPIADCTADNISRQSTIIEKRAKNIKIVLLKLTTRMLTILRSLGLQCWHSTVYTVIYLCGSDHICCVN